MQELGVRGRGVRGRQNPAIKGDRKERKGACTFNMPRALATRSPMPSIPAGRGDRWVPGLRSRQELSEGGNHGQVQVAAKSNPLPTFWVYGDSPSSASSFKDPSTIAFRPLLAFRWSTSYLHTHPPHQHSPPNPPRKQYTASGPISFPC